MKRLVMSIGLTCLLSISALAGDIPTVDFVPPRAAQSSTATAPGDIPTGDFARQISNEAKLIVLRTIFSLFAR